MTMPAHILRVFALFKAAYPRWYAEQSAETLAMFAALVSDAMPADLERAAVEHARTSKWPPTVSELLELARGEVAASAALAWERVTTTGDRSEAERRAVEIAGGERLLRSIVTHAEYGPPASGRRYDARDEAQHYRRFAEAFDAVSREIARARERERSAAIAVRLVGGAIAPQLTKGTA